MALARYEVRQLFIGACACTVLGIAGVAYQGTPRPTGHDGGSCAAATVPASAVGHPVHSITPPIERRPYAVCPE